MLRYFSRGETGAGLPSPMVAQSSAQKRSQLLIEEWNMTTGVMHREDHAQREGNIPIGRRANEQKLASMPASMG